MPYPIIEERPLPPAERRFLRSRRDLGQLPDKPPGAVLVFEVAGGHYAFTERRHLKGSEDELVEAISASVVDVRTSPVIVGLRLPSADLAHDFPLQVTFTCTVTAPEKIVKQGLTDVAAVLARHLAGDAELLSMGMRRPIEAVHELRPQVVARVKAYLDVLPAEIDGMEVRLSAVDLLLPDDVRGHARDLRTVRRQGEVAELLHALENKDVARIEEILGRGTSAGLALAISRGHIPIGDAVTIQRESDDQRAAYLHDMIKAMPEGSLDFLPLNTRVLIEELARSVIGPQAAGSMFGPAERSAELENGQTPRPLGLEDLDD